jgi:hypothetical protein
VAEKRKIPSPCWDLNLPPHHPAHSPVLYHRAIPAPVAIAVVNYESSVTFYVSPGECDIPLYWNYEISGLILK